MKNYKPTIGIEVHAELKTKSKMFCGCKNDPHAAEPNQNTCPVCLAHPGTLPTVNKQAVTYMMMVGRALHGELATYSVFDRKNYFYPDIPKAYQLSQYEFPFVKGGKLGGVEITRVHLEEDTARSSHDSGTSIVDFNRAGVPLMELVTEPVVHDSVAAMEFAKELQLLLRTLGVSDANMEKGEMRVEANVSISADKTLGTKVEVKNLNSFKVVGAAIEFEIKRQTELLDKGETVVQETRGWDENKSKTFSQRVKESADDYRYFPDPDIPKVDRASIPEFSESRIDEILPETPVFKRDKYKDLGLNDSLIEVVICDPERDKFFQDVLKVAPKGVTPKSVANYLTSDILGLLEDSEKTIQDVNVSTFSQVLVLVSDSSVTSRVAKDLIAEFMFEDSDMAKIAEERGLLQSNSEEDMLPLIKQIIADHQSVVEEYKAGKEASLKFLVGQGMKVSKGSANPQLLEKLLKENI